MILFVLIIFRLEILSLKKKRKCIDELLEEKQILMIRIILEKIINLRKKFYF